jgi:phosphohistidine swiveling domain-containing protein
MTAFRDLHFDPPGPGPWNVERVHITRPVTGFGAALVPGAIEEGFRESMVRYGGLIDSMEFGIVNRVPYQRVLPVGRKDGPGEKLPPKLLMQALVRLHPEFRRRARAAQKAEVGKLWLQDLQRWDEEVKPATLRRHRELLAVDLAALDDAALSAHIDECATWARRMIVQHHQFNAAAMGPTGRFLSAARRWTGLDVPELLQLLAGASPVSAGWVPEADALATALRDDPEAAAQLTAEADAAAVLEWLRTREGPVGDATRAYLEVVGYRIVGGYDLGDRYALETPELVLGSIRRAASGEPWVDEAQLRADTERVRALVPPERLIEFHELLDEARRTYRLRDERGLYSDSLGTGILRRAVLEAGRRLASADRVRQADHAVEAAPDELRALLGGEAGPSAAELAERYDFRTQHTNDEAPEHLGPPEAPPPPLEWLPQGAMRRGMEAIGAVMEAVFAPAPAQEGAASALAHGHAASPGVYEGVARLVRSAADFDRIQQGDVIVTTSTSPTFNIVLPRAGAIVTDHGGVLSHAAIVAREYGIPAVVGCGDATSVITDGATIRVDGAAGRVERAG